MFATDAMEIRFVQGAFREPGPATAWFRLRRPLVAGEPTSPFARAAAAGDFGNGIASVMSWEEHLPTLFAMKKAGRLRYVGVTTSEGRRHAEIEKIMRSQPIDFVQVSYNAIDRDVEERILPLALERRIGVICNRPLRRGELIRKVEHAPLPSWAGEIDCTSWAQILLKFIVSHPAVVCAIPATTRVDHVRENVAASRGRLPDESIRRRIAALVEKL